MTQIVLTSSLVPCAPLVAIKTALLLALLCATGRLLTAAVDALLGGTDDLPWRTANRGSARSRPRRG